ncbi:MAG: hypothetical protein V4760_02090 [Bdellovibrionota bacterium]
MSLKIALSILALAAATHAHASSEDLFDDVKGSYDVKMQIGGRTFDEELLIADVRPSSTGGTYGRSFTGLYNVPGIFISEVHDGKIRRRYLCGGLILTNVEFSIVARENGHDYPVSIRASGDICNLKGTAKLADGTEIGQLTMKQNSPECTMGI